METVAESGMEEWNPISTIFSAGVENERAGAERGSRTSLAIKFSEENGDRYNSIFTVS